MDAIFCSGCGAKLEEAPTLLPDQRLPCPACGSLARRFEQDVTDQIALSDRGTATDTVTVTRTVGFEAVVYAETAEAIGTAIAATHVTFEAPGDFDLAVERRDWDDSYGPNLGT